MLDDDGDVGFDDARVVLVARDVLGHGEIVEPQMLRSAGRNSDVVRARGFAIAEVHRYRDVGRFVRGVEQARRFVTRELRLLSMAIRRYEAFSDGPAPLSNR